MPLNLGELYCMIGGDTAGILRAERETNRATGNIQRDLDRTQKAAGMLKNAMGAIGLSVSFGAIIKATTEAEQAMAQLEAGVASTGKAAGLSADELAAMAKSLQSVSTYGDEAVMQAESVMLTFTRIGRETFPQATKAAMDMATRMKSDLSGAALQVGKALNDPIAGVTALSRAGVQFSGSQKAMIESLVKSGDQLGAQKIVLRELQTEFGGASQAARNTMGGALTALKEAFGDLLEAPGGMKDARVGIEEFTALLQSDSVTQAAGKMATGTVRAMTAVVKTFAQGELYYREMTTGVQWGSNKIVEAIGVADLMIENKFSDMEIGWVKFVDSFKKGAAEIATVANMELPKFAQFDVSYDPSEAKNKIAALKKEKAMRFVDLSKMITADQVVTDEDMGKILGLKQEIKALEDQITATGEAMRAGGGAMNEYSKGAKDGSEATAKASNALEDYLNKMETETEALKRLGEGNEDAAEATKVRADLEKDLGRALTATEQADVKAAIAAVSQAEARADVARETIKAKDALAGYVRELEGQNDILQERARGDNALADRLSRESTVKGQLGTGVSIDSPEAQAALRQLERQDELNAAIRERSELESRAGSIIDGVLTKEEQQVKTVETLTQAYEKGIISYEKYGNTLERLNKEWSGQERMIEGLADSFSSSYQRMVLEGEDWRDSMAGLMKDVQRIIFETMVTDPLKQGLKGILGKGMDYAGFGPAYSTGSPASMGGGWLGGLLGGKAAASPAIDAGGLIGTVTASKPGAAFVGMDTQPQERTSRRAEDGGGGDVVIVNVASEDAIASIVAGRKVKRLVINHVFDDIEQGGTLRKTIKAVGR